MRKAYCEEGQHYPDKIISILLNSDSASGNIKGQTEVLLDGEGNSTFLYADGTKGVSDEESSRAEEDEEPYCVEHQDCVIQWRDE